MRSMTGFGTAEGKVGRGRLFVEVKSVNHRFSEVSIKMPGRMSSLEANIRKLVQQSFERGKIDVFVKEKEPLFGAASLSIDTELAGKYQNILKKLKKDLSLKGDADFFKVVGIDRIIRVEEDCGDYARLWGKIAGLIDKATQCVKKMRTKEGLYILKDQKKRLSRLERLLRSIEKKTVASRKNNMERIINRNIDNHSTDVSDAQRLQMEAQVLDKQDISEEVVRLSSHVKQYRSLIRGGGSVGRKLDFLLQEMGREANTIGSKASDVSISQLIVECKAEMERLREQIQNIE